MYPGAVEFFLKGNGVKNLDEVKKYIGDMENGLVY